MIRLAVHEDAAVRLEQHLRASAPAEDGAFMLVRSAAGTGDQRLVASELILPPPDAWEGQAEDHLRPSAQWLSAVISRAVDADAGLLFIHSHPDPLHPAGFSPVDEVAIAALGKTMDSILDGPFAAAVVHADGWVAAQWSATGVFEVEAITGEGLATRSLGLAPVTSADDEALDVRQRDALGLAHDRLRRLHVGVVGCGGLGSPIAEQLVRMGVCAVTLIDGDRLDTESNVRRIFGSTTGDLHPAIAPAKVDVVGRHLDGLGLGTVIKRLAVDVRTEEGLRALLDCDVVINGTDTHSSRALVNDLPSTYLLPVIDVGVRVSARRSGSLAGLIAEVRLLTPDRPCLWCRDVIDPDRIRAENLPDDERERLEREGYVTGAVGEPAPSVAALTVMAAGMATSALIGILSEAGPVLPSGWIFDGLLGDAHETGTGVPDPGCRCRSQLGQADRATPPLLDPAEPTDSVGTPADERR